MSQHLEPGRVDDVAQSPAGTRRHRPPLLTAPLHDALLALRDAGGGVLCCSLDLDRSTTEVRVTGDDWTWQASRYPFMQQCRARTIYHWTGSGFEAAARYGSALIKLVPTEWGAPTFEIDGIKMLPTAQLSPYDDARRKVALIRAQGKTVLDTCGGLGYFAAWCIAGGARRVVSFEKNADVIWLRGLNPWSPDHRDTEGDGRVLSLQQGDVSEEIGRIESSSMDAILHDPPRFGIAGELYSQRFYDELARVLVPGGHLFHYTGTPNRLTSRRDVPGEVAARLQRAGFATERVGDGLLAVKTAPRKSRR